jgi:hypothetical protein
MTGTSSDRCGQTTHLWLHYREDDVVFGAQRNRVEWFASLFGGEALHARNDPKLPSLGITQANWSADFGTSLHCRDVGVDRRRANPLVR